MIDPLRIAFDVALPARADVRAVDRREPACGGRRPTRSARSRASRSSIEPGVGGRIYERTPEGEEHDWGEVTGWEPPNRISYLWHLRQDRADATEVEITFTATEGDGTTVSIVHHGWERLGARGQERRDSTSAAGPACFRTSRPPRRDDGRLEVRVADVPAQVEDREESPVIAHSCYLI